MKLRLCFSNRVRLNNRIILGLFSSLFILYLCGLDTYLYQEDYFAGFTYPLEVNLTHLIIQLRTDQTPDIPPTNHFPYTLLLDSPHICQDTARVDLLIVVKSLITNYQNRRAIRDTWLSATVPGRVIRHVFLVATSARYNAGREQLDHQDLVQGSFRDEYFNNTLKTIMGFQWVKQRCSNAEFVLFADDDYYVNPTNVLRLTDAPDSYPVGRRHDAGSWGQRADQQNGIDPADDIRYPGEVKSASGQHLYTGFLFFVLPVRIPFHRFYVSLAEYPYNIFPPFINGGAYVVSRETLLGFYYATLYTEPFRMDDIYIGILAKKLGVDPEHNRYFFPHLVPYSDSVYGDLIASHGYRDPDDLRDVWYRKGLADKDT